VPLLVLVYAGAAAAAPQSVSHTVTGTLELLGYACPPSGKCVATGVRQGANPNQYSGVIVPVSGGAPGVVHEVTDTQALFGVACPRANHCIATADTSSGKRGVLIPITSGAAGPAIQAHMSTLFAIACPSQRSCWATGTSSTGQAAVVHLIASKPKTFAFKGQPGALFTGALGTALYCAPDNSCVTAGEARNGAPMVIFLSKGKITRTKALPMAPFGAGTFGLACTTVDSCLAFGVAPDGVRQVMIPIRQGMLGAPHHLKTQLLAVSCRSWAMCFGFGLNPSLPASSDDVAVRIKNGKPGSPQAVPKNVRAGDAWCESARCVVVGSILHTQPNSQVGALYSFP
jgi:hypothetical protein